MKKTRLQEEKELTGKRIDTNWLKYKVYRNNKYLKKLNELISKLVIIDIELERREVKGINVQTYDSIKWPLKNKSDNWKTGEENSGNKTRNYTEQYFGHTNLEKRKALTGAESQSQNCYDSSNSNDGKKSGFQFLPPRPPTLLDQAVPKL